MELDAKLLDSLQALYFNTDRRGKWVCSYTADNTGDYEQRVYKMIEETRFGPATIIDGIFNPADGMFIAFIHNHMPEIIDSLIKGQEVEDADEGTD